MGGHVHSQEKGTPKNCPSLISSRMRREEKLFVSCGKVLREVMHTIVHTKEGDEDEDIVGSSHYSTICDKDNASTHARIKDKFSNFHACRHIAFNDGDPQEDEDAKDAPPKLEEEMKNTVDTLKEVNLRVDDDMRVTYISASLSDDEERKYIELLMEFRDVFYCSYKEMPGLDNKIAVYRLAVKQ